MLTIRLSRIGKKKQPSYRFIISEKTKDPWGDNLEILGHYNPRTNPATIVLKEDRIKHWLSKGATLSDTVHNLFVDKKLISGDKRRIVQMSRKKQATAAEAKVKEAEAAVAKAAKAAQAAESASAETPAEPEAPPEA
jgi:small subunit ribosomal protein S16